MKLYKTFWIAYRWQVMKDENWKIKEVKGENYEPKVFSNGDTLRQLLARSRYLLFCSGQVAAKPRR